LLFVEETYILLILETHECTFYPFAEN